MTFSFLLRFTSGDVGLTALVVLAVLFLTVGATLNLEALAPEHRDATGEVFFEFVAGDLDADTVVGLGEFDLSHFFFHRDTSLSCVLSSYLYMHI